MKKEMKEKRKGEGGKEGVHGEKNREEWGIEKREKKRKKND